MHAFIKNEQEVSLLAPKGVGQLWYKLGRNYRHNILNKQIPAKSVERNVHNRKCTAL